GLKTSDRALPQEALNDLDKMRETLELVITQSKEMGVDKSKAADAMALLEEASVSRSMIARDDYDAKRWRDEVADTRESMANSRSTVLSAVTEGDSSLAQVMPSNSGTGNTTAPVFQPVADTQTRERQVANEPSDNNVAKNDKPTYVVSQPPVVTEQPKVDQPKLQPKQEQPVIQEPKQETKTVAETPKTERSKSTAPVDVGSLVSYVTKQTQPVYPQVARSMHMTGVVRVDVLIDENGEVAQVQKASGPILLQGAAKDAILKWKFRPVVRDGQPVKANGYIAFSFN
ncbi:MAG: TonB family protein, partial [Acidobacteria bacterium]|nr:TonB family protein [Acidobacteriota bacterium]